MKISLPDARNPHAGQVRAGCVFLGRLYCESKRWNSGKC